MCAQSCSTLATPWIVACQVPLSMGFSRQEYWSGLPSPPPGNLQVSHKCVYLDSHTESSRIFVQLFRFSPRCQFAPTPHHLAPGPFPHSRSNREASTHRKSVDMLRGGHKLRLAGTCGGSPVVSQILSLGMMVITKHGASEVSSFWVCPYRRVDVC